ncbi:hypothetical protein ACNKHK_21805 [Shigella flexneri]
MRNPFLPPEDRCRIC